MQPTKIENWVQESIDNRSVAAQKDFRHAVHIILKAISLSENLSKSMIFKGGMLLGIKYQSERYTTDLDFSTAEKLDPNCIQDFKEEFNDRLEYANNLLAYGMRLKIQRIEKRPKKDVASFPALEIKIAYLGTNCNQSEINKYENNQAPNTISIDYSFNELNNDVESIVIDEEENEKIICYTLESIIAEKLRSILQQKPRNRTRGQDIYDICFLLSDYDDQLSSIETKNKILNLLKQKSIGRDIDELLHINGLNDEDIKTRSKIGFKAIEPQLTTTANFEDLYNQLNKFYQSLPWNKS